MTKSKTTMTDSDHWFVEDSDGLTFLVRHAASRRHVIVEVDAELGAWVCSACGSFLFAQARAGMLTCQHINTVTRRMPQAQAFRVANIAVPPKRPTQEGRNEKTPAAIERQVAEALERGADARARRAAEHDGSYVAASPVVVRQMTADDLAKLEARRAAKAMAYETPIGMPRRY